jgi:hypothetical protein
MDDTASSFSTRSNAKRAAEQMIAKGTALTVDYDIKPRNGRFEVVWKTALTTAEFAETTEAQVNQASKAEAEDWPNTAATTDEVEVEIATATANADESAASGKPAPITAPPVANMTDADFALAGPNLHISAGRERVGLRLGFSRRCGAGLRLARWSGERRHRRRGAVRCARVRREPRQ